MLGDKTMGKGNSGHHGYRMSKVAAIKPQGQTVCILLECGHIQYSTPDLNTTAEEWVKLLQGQEGYTSDPIIIGKTRRRCEQAHNGEHEQRSGLEADNEQLRERVSTLEKELKELRRQVQINEESLDSVRHWQAEYEVRHNY